MTLSFKTVAWSRSFIVTILVFVLANLYSWLRHSLFPVCCDQEVTVGFPFPFHISGGIGGAANFYLLGLLLDIVLAFTLAVLARWIAVSLARYRK
jgi:hypothetical protein